MDVQLQELIDKIKKDGIEASAEASAKARAAAETDAARIVEAAKKEADAIIAKAKAEAERAEKAGIAALEQAARNGLLAFRGEIESLLSKVAHKETVAGYSASTITTVLPKILEAWPKKGSDELTVLVDEASLSAVQAFFKEKLSAELKKGIELKSDRTLGAGFRIASRDGSAYYDFSAEAVVELLSSYLNPRLADILKGAVAES